MLHTPNDLIDVKFEKAVAFGYRTEEVDDYVAKVSQTLTSLLQDKQMLEDKLEILAGKVEEYRDDEESLRAALLGAQKLGDSIVRESKTKSETLLREANEKADTTVAEATSTAQAALKDANQKAEAIVSEANQKADTIVQNATNSLEKERKLLVKMQKEVSTFKDTLLVMYKRHLELISEMPELDDKEAQEKPSDASAAIKKPTAVIKPFPVDMDDSAPKTEDIATNIPPAEPIDYEAEESTAFASEPPRRQTSRFGELKFGTDFDPERESDSGRMRRKEK